MERIVVTWAFNSWKTTTIKLLREEWFNICEETARELLINMKKRPEDFTKEELEAFQKEVYFQQVKKEILHKWHVFDSSVIDILAYAEDTDVYNYLYDVIKWYLTQYPYKQVFLLKPITKIEDDWLRHTDSEFQRIIFNRIKKILEDFDINYILVSGNIKNRLQIILDNIKWHEYKR